MWDHLWTSHLSYFQASKCWREIFHQLGGGGGLMRIGHLIILILHYAKSASLLFALCAAGMNMTRHDLESCDLASSFRDSVDFALVLI